MSVIETSFKEKLQAQAEKGKFVCVGLDPNPDKLPLFLQAKAPDQSAFSVQMFLKNIVDHTADIAAAFKPNIAFFAGNPYLMDEYMNIIDHIKFKYPHIPIIGDMKRADIGETNKGYAKEAYDRYGVDALTTSPYFGGDTFEPFQTYEGKGLIVLCKTSNKGSRELQDLSINLAESLEDGLIAVGERFEINDLLEGKSPRVYQMVAFMAARRWNKDGNMGLVVGATHPEAFIPVRRLAPDLPILIPGVGSQGGDLEKTLLYAPDSNGQNFLISSSGAILYASAGEDYAEAARRETLKLDVQIRQGLGI